MWLLDFDFRFDAARREGVRAQILKRRGAGIDHPIALGVNETEYLK